jgi:hypothetical protein
MSITKLIINLFFFVTIAMLISFVTINVMLGCETWDRQHWTFNNSCMTVMDAYQMLRDLKG